MVDDRDIGTDLAARVREAGERDETLDITGTGTKSFYCGQPEGKPLHVGLHRGVVSYEPSELVITARAGTPLSAIEATLGENSQMLGFEPPHYGEGATLGGAIACGFSGPRRPYAGAARDFVLGVKIINGKGEILSFGGQVMKNVAGYDVSRLMCGSLGTLAVILEVSLKVLPQSASEVTLAFEMGPDAAIARMNEWAAQPLPLSAACHSGDTLYVRLSGTDTAVKAASTKLGGKVYEKGAAYWETFKEHRRAFFEGGTPLWRLSVPPAAPMLDLPGKWRLDWGGAQRWLKSAAPAQTIRRAAESVGGYATLFRGEIPGVARFHPLAPAMQALQQRVKHSLDPAGIFNRALTRQLIGDSEASSKARTASGAGA